jgi:hypothetical protein
LPTSLCISRRRPFILREWGIWGGPITLKVGTNIAQPQNRWTQKDRKMMKDAHTSYHLQPIQNVMTHGDFRWGPGKAFANCRFSARWTVGSLPAPAAQVKQLTMYKLPMSNRSSQRSRVAPEISRGKGWQWQLRCDKLGKAQVFPIN